MKVQFFSVAILAALGLMSTTQAVELQAENYQITQRQTGKDGKPAEPIKMSLVNSGSSDKDINLSSTYTPKIVAQPTVSVNGKPAFALGNIQQLATRPDQVALAKTMAAIMGQTEQATKDLKEEAAKEPEIPEGRDSILGLLDGGFNFELDNFELTTGLPVVWQDPKPDPVVPTITISASSGDGTPIATDTPVVVNAPKAGAAKAPAAPAAPAKPDYAAFAAAAAGGAKPAGK